MFSLFKSKPKGVARGRMYLIEEIDRRADTDKFSLNRVQAGAAVKALAEVFCDLGVEDSEATVRLLIAEEQNRRSIKAAVDADFARRAEEQDGQT